MKKCMFGIVVDDSENFGNNENQFFELEMAEGKIFVPIVEMEEASLIKLKQTMVRTIKILFNNVLKEENPEMFREV